MATLVWWAGFNNGRVPSATGNTARRYVDGATSVSVVSLGGGDYVLQCSGTTTISNITLTSNTLGSTAHVVAVGKLRFPTALPSTSPDVLVLSATGGDALFMFFQQSSSKLAVAWGAGTPVVGPVVTFDRHYTVDVHVDTSANPNVLEWWVDGVKQTNASAAQASGTVNGFIPGRDSAGTGTNYWDDLRVSATAADAPLGDGRVFTSLPDTGGTATEIGTANSVCRFTSNGSGLDTTFNSADILAAISEVPPTIGGTATGLYQRTSGTGNAISIPMTSTTLGGGETIEACIVRVLLWSGSATANNLELRAWDGNAETTLIAREDPNGSNSTTDPAWWCAPYTPSGGWSQAKLDAFEVRIGYSNDVSPNPGAHQISADFAINKDPAAPSTVAAVASVPSVTVSTGGGGDATATPSTVAGTATVGAATVSTGSTVSPSVLAGTATISAVTAQGGANATPATVAGTATVPAPTISTGSTPTPTTVQATATIPTPGAVTGSTIGVSTVAGTATVPTPAAQGGVGTTPTTVPATATVPTPDASTGSTAAPGTVHATAAIPTPAAQAGSDTTPATATATTAIPTPTASASSTATPGTVAATASSPPPAAAASSTATPGAVAATVAVPSPTISTGTAATPDAAIASATIPPPSVDAQGDITIDVATVAAATSIPTPAAGTGSTSTPATVTGTASIPTPDATTGATATPTTTQATSGIPTPVATASSTSTPTTVASSVLIPPPEAEASATATPAAIGAAATIPAPTVVAEGTVSIVMATFVDPAGDPVPRGDVNITLIAGTPTTPGYTLDGTVGGEWNSVTDNDGQWSVALPGNSTYLPDNTYYQAVTTDPTTRRKYISAFVVPATGGPYNLVDLLIVPTPPAALGITAVTVAANGTVAGVRPGFNIVAGPGITVTAVDDPDNTRVNITIRVT